MASNRLQRDPGLSAHDPAEALRRALRAQARAQRPITYDNLASVAVVAAPHRIHKVTLMLEEMIRVDHQHDRPLLAALAVSKTNDMPGKGYFQLLKSLGRYKGPDQGPEAKSQHQIDLARAFAYWGL